MNAIDILRGIRIRARYWGHRISVGNNYMAESPLMDIKGIHFCTSKFPGFEKVTGRLDYVWMRDYEVITEEVDEWLDENAMDRHPRNWNKESIILFFLRFR